MKATISEERTLKYLLLLLAIAAIDCHADEMAERDEVRNESGMLFRSSNFEELEGLAATYRDQSMRTISGMWKLFLFYEGIATVGLSFSKDDQEMWRADLSRFDNWISKHPDSATPHIARAAALIGRGWTLRGKGFVQGVDEDHLQEFRKLAAETGEYLMKHEALKFEDPHWYLLMTTVYEALGIGKDAFWTLYVEGLELHPNYDPFIFIAANYYSPRWYGSYEEIERLARYTSEVTADTRDFSPYARLYWVAGYNRNARMFAFQLPTANWNDMVRGMDAVIERYPSQWNLSHFGYFACFARDREAAAKYIKLITEPIIEQAWASERNYQGCRLFSGLSPSPNIPLP